MNKIFDSSSAGKTQSLEQGIKLESGLKHVNYSQCITNTENNLSLSQEIDPDNIAKTKKFLDGAIVIAWRDAMTNSRPPALTRTRWVWRLASTLR